MSAQNPVMLDGPARATVKIAASRLFVHECRRMAAPADGAGRANCATKFGRQRRACAAMIRHGLIPQNRSGCSSPRVPAPRRGRPSRFWGCRATTSRSAIPRPGALRGSRASSGNFIAVRDCATIRPDFSAFIEQLLATGHFDVLLPTHEQGFLFARVRQRLAGRVGLALPGFESYRAAHSKAGFSRLLDRLDLPQPPTRIVTSAQMTARRRPRFPPSSRPRSAPPAAASGSCAMPTISKSRCTISRRAARSPTRCWCRISSRARPRRRNRCFAAAGCSAFMPIGRSPPASAAARRSSKASAGRSCARISRRSGEQLDWHGALSVDYIMPDRRRRAAADRLQSAAGRADERLSFRHRSGRAVAADLARRDAGGVAGKPRGRADASGDAGAARMRLARRHAARHRQGMLAPMRPASGPTPAAARNSRRCGWTGSSAVPLAMTAALLLASPKSAVKLARGGFGAHLLDLGSIRVIESEDLAVTCSDGWSEARPMHAASAQSD